MRKISRRSFIKAATFTAAAAALTACGGSSSSTTTASSTAASAAAATTPSNKGTGVTLTVYTNSETDGRDEWLIERAAQDGCKVQVVGAGAADTQNRLLAEKASPIADVVFGLNAIIWESLKAENILIPFVPEWAAEVPAGLTADEGYNHAIVKQAILLVYDQNQLTEDQAPTDWPDLWTKPEFDKKYEYLTSLAGGTVRNVIAGILTRYADPNGDLGIAQEGWDAIAEYYKHGVPNEDGVDLYAQIASENSSDAVIAFSFPRYSSTTTKGAKYCRSAGATVIGITDSKLSPLGSSCDHVLIAKSDMVSLVDSLVAPLSIVNALIVAIASQKEKELSKTFANLERIWEEYDVYEKQGQD